MDAGNEAEYTFASECCHPSCCVDTPSHRPAIATHPLAAPFEAVKDGESGGVYRFLVDPTSPSGNFYSQELHQPMRFDATVAKETGDILANKWVTDRTAHLATFVFVIDSLNSVSDARDKLQSGIAMTRSFASHCRCTPCMIARRSAQVRMSRQLGRC